MEQTLFRELLFPPPAIPTHAFWCRLKPPTNQLHLKKDIFLRHSKGLACLQALGKDCSWVKLVHISPALAHRPLVMGGMK